ncbi:VCBS repeat-containing protein [Streptomyces sp. NPDC047315]|uniref:FG-GAP repeat domain-containing protein n=1 Tax=Streptomyces sp. NPDC047315 TaxID=3155142 RepID=UPI0033DD8669
MTSISQKVRKALPAALAATMLGSAVLMAAPAQANEVPAKSAPSDVRDLAKKLRAAHQEGIKNGQVPKVSGRSGAAAAASSLNGDNKADLVAAKPNGDVYIYTSKGTSFNKPEYVPEADYTYFNLIRQVGDLDNDGYPDMIARTTDGWLLTSAWTPDAGVISGGWGGFKNLTVTGDINGDGREDLTANDAAGNFYMWRGGGDYHFGARKTIGSGWANYTTIGRGDYSGDGRPDLLARDPKGGLWMYKGTGRSELPFKSRVLVGSGWNFTAYVSTGDMTGDGVSDFLVRDKSGTMYGYPGRGSETVPFKTSSRFTIGGGWNTFSLFG